MKPTPLLVANAAGLLFALVAAVHSYMAHQLIATSLFFVPFALFGAYMSYLLREFKPALSFTALAFVWLCAVLV